MEGFCFWLENTVQIKHFDEILEKTVTELLNHKKYDCMDESSFAETQNLNHVTVL